MYPIADFFVCRCNTGLTVLNPQGLAEKKNQEKKGVCHSPNLLQDQICTFKIEFIVEL